MARIHKCTSLMRSLYEQMSTQFDFFFFFVLCNRLYHLICIWANKKGQKVGSEHYMLTYRGRGYLSSWSLYHQKRAPSELVSSSAVSYHCVCQFMQHVWIHIRNQNRYISSRACHCPVETCELISRVTSH